MLMVEALASQGQTFVARDQNQRGALAILGGNLYVPFGGHFGDCGQYRGFVVGISLSELSIRSEPVKLIVAFGAKNPDDGVRVSIGRGHYRSTSATY